MGNARALRADNSRTPTTVVENYFEEREIRAEISATVLPFSARQLSKASGCSTDAAKLWIAGDRTPNLNSTINMARSLPAVSQWLADKVGWRAADAMSADAVIRWAHEYRNTAGLDGQIAKAVLAAVVGNEPAPKPSVVSEADYDPRAAVHDLFPRRRA